jgi:hypothetical protein
MLERKPLPSAGRVVREVAFASSRERRAFPKPRLYISNAIAIAAKARSRVAKSLTSYGQSNASVALSTESRSIHCGKSDSDTVLLYKGISQNSQSRVRKKLFTPRRV